MKPAIKKRQANVSIGPDHFTWREIESIKNHRNVDLSCSSAVFAKSLPQLLLI